MGKKSCRTRGSKGSAPRAQACQLAVVQTVIASCDRLVGQVYVLYIHITPPRGARDVAPPRLHAGSGAAKTYLKFTLLFPRFD